MWLYELTRQLRPFWSLYWSFDLVGAVDAIPRTGPALVAANHSSFLDPWMLGIPFPRNVRQLINRDWYERSTSWRLFFEANGTIPLEPSAPGVVVDSVLRAFDRGDLVGIFPEGRISRDGRLQRFRSGVAFLSARTGAPVLPVGIRGAHASMPRTKRWPRPESIEIHVGRPRAFEGSLDDRDSIRSFRDGLRGDIARLAGLDEP